MRWRRQLIGLSGLDIFGLGGEQNYLAEVFGQPILRRYARRVAEEPDRGPPSGKPSIALVRKLGAVFSFATNSFLKTR
jgi:hypothetical protein